MITKTYANNWWEHFCEVQEAMMIDADFCLDVLTVVATEVPFLVVKARQLVSRAFVAKNAARRSHRLPKASRGASIVVRTKIAPRPTNEKPDLLWKA